MAGLLADYYRTLREDRGFEQLPSGLGGLPESYVRRTFACAERGGEFADGVESGAGSMVTVGITPTGPPHVGTLGQLQIAIDCQRAGLDVQVVVADLAAYNGAGHDLGGVRELAGHYQDFARELGFDADEGILRTHLDDCDVLRTAQLLSRYYEPGASNRDDHEPTRFEEALAEAYENADRQGSETTDFAGQQVGLLLVADSLHPIVREDYENVALVVGADNAGMAGGFLDVLERSPWDGTVAGLYTKLVGGLDGYPKLSKSIPESRFTLADDPVTIRDAVLDPDNDADEPAESVVFQVMQLASEYDPGELDRLADACTEGGPEWDEAKEEYADYLGAVAEQWSAVTSGSSRHTRTR